MTLTVTFAIGTDVDRAQSQVQSRVDRAKPRLPQEVQRLGIVNRKVIARFNYGGAFNLAR